MPAGYKLDRITDEEDEMTCKTLYRWAAVALAVSGLSLAAGMILNPVAPLPESVPTFQWAASHFLWWLGALSGAVGIAGLYVRQREQVGVLGFAGGGLSVIGSTLIASAMYFEAFIAPSLAARIPWLFEAHPTGGGWEGFATAFAASGALFGVGFLLLGIAVIRAGTMARWGILLAMVGGVPFAVNFLLPQPVTIVAVVIFAVGLLRLGYGLRKSVGPDESAVREAPALGPVACQGAGS